MPANPPNASATGKSVREHGSLLHEQRRSTRYSSPGCGTE